MPAKKVTIRKRVSKKVSSRPVAAKKRVAVRKRTVKKASVTTEPERPVRERRVTPLSFSSPEDIIRSHAELKSENEKQRNMMKGCIMCLRRFVDICKPRSRWGGVGILCVGVVIGIVLAGSLLYVAKNESPFQILRGQNKTADVVLVDGVPIRTSEEIDYSFVPPAVPFDLQDVDLRSFWSVWRHIEQDFVPQPTRYRAENEGDLPTSVNSRFVEKPNRDDLLHGATQGLTQATGDIYTNFFLPEDARGFEDEVLEGEIDGIGAYISIIDGQLTVVKPIEDSPALRAGLRADDIILEIDGVPSSAYNLIEATHVIRGPRGTEVALKLYRPLTEEELVITIVRGQIEIPTVETEIRDGIFVIVLSTFTKQTPRLFTEALREFVETANNGGPDRILLDLRGNVGGVLSVAVYIAELFLPEDSVVLYEYSGTEKLKAFRTDRPIFRGEMLPEVTVLVDGATASASEILAAALRHYGIVDIVGVHTMGKGSVQALKSIGDEEALLKITIAHWLTPEKISIGGVGITPDVDYEEGIAALLEEDSDADVDAYVLDRALEHILGK